MEQSQILYDNANRSRPSSVASGSNMIATGPLLKGEKFTVTKRPDRPDSRASGRSTSSRLSFMPSTGGKDRNRFFSPKQMDYLPPTDDELKSRDEIMMIKDLYKEFSAVVKRNLQPETN